MFVCIQLFNPIYCVLTLNVKAKEKKSDNVLGKGRNGKCFCSCDSSFESSSLSTFSSVEALMLCSMRCSQTSSCVAYNFFTASNQCQLFNRTMEKFSKVSSCQHYFRRGLLFNNSLRITVDNELSEFYIDGSSVPVASNFPNAKVWSLTDTYNFHGQHHIIAIKSQNLGGTGGLIARTSNNNILTNSTWKCTRVFYNGWYEMDYNDLFWPDAVVGKREQDTANAMPTLKPALWITDATDCYDCTADFYCRKDFIAYVSMETCTPGQ
ncbi:hypothetical protein HELRODRAFT_160758 [Helobdella robusta]|uniref:Apple domain-containing protein n=1 Tax=Helobdella robusta TaxID=6412 RepID=T1EQP3_HELRO|nr:hypothetical protein HELRODRAFT_160758 [Helobdella robusta]ESO06575.1 hypothetical protein HELRODRAFT_160758 [Helobdella robusta]